LAPLPIGRCNLAQKFKFIEAFACSFRDRAQRIFRNMDRQTSFLAQKFIETAQKRATTGQDEPAIDQVGR
jgi:Uri superfamily endonuclease